METRIAEMREAQGMKRTELATRAGVGYGRARDAGIASNTQPYRHRERPLPRPRRDERGAASTMPIP